MSCHHRTSAACQHASAKALGVITSDIITTHGTPPLAHSPFGPQAWPRGRCCLHCRLLSPWRGPSSSGTCCVKLECLLSHRSMSRWRGPGGARGAWHRQQAAEAALARAVSGSSSSSPASTRVDGPACMCLVALLTTIVRHKRNSDCLHLSID